MEKKRKWQLALILTVIGLTVYNIIPTLFYYLKPLKSPISAVDGAKIADDIANRVNALEGDAEAWLHSFCDLVHVKPYQIATDPQNPQIISVNFAKSEEAARFRHFLPRAGSLIPFVPAQLGLVPSGEDSKEVLVQRLIPVRLDGKGMFSFADKSEGPLYKETILDRAVEIGYALGGPSNPALAIDALDARSPYQAALIEEIASQINVAAELIREKSPVAIRYASRFTQGPFSDRQAALQSVIGAFDSYRDALKKEKSENSDEERLRLLERKEAKVLAAEASLKKHLSLFAAGQDPWNGEQIRSLLSTDTLVLGNRNPFFSSVVINWAKDQIVLKLHPGAPQNKQLLIDEIAKITNLTQETAVAGEEGYTIPFHKMGTTSSLLVLDLGKVAKTELRQIGSALKSSWHPQHPDLQNIPIVGIDEYETLIAEQKALCLILVAPVADGGGKFANLRNSSIYVIAKGVDKILQNTQQFPDSDLTRTFHSDFRRLAELLRGNGFRGYAPGKEFAGDFVFEQHNFYQTLLAATRENFVVHGTQKYACLELSDLEQRIGTQNKIDTAIHEDLLKWKDEYDAASVSLNSSLRTDVPKPTKSIFVNNVLLSMKKFFRGDEKKVIHWGLDLQGGKTVQIELRDAYQKAVTDEEDIKQGINELYNRVNKMGVSEVVIRQVGNHIVLDFPGSQSLSASDLIKASSMSFHVVNEKFSPHSPMLGESVNSFLREVWNEAVVTGKRDTKEVNAIAWKHLYGDEKTEAARSLAEQGLVLQSPDDMSVSNRPDESICKIAVFRDSDTQNPLMIVFRNYALEGSELQNIHSSYDPSKGNYLSFEVKGKESRDSLYAWTSQFSKEKILGTPNEMYSAGHGWRMAVILNDTVISSPTLDSPLRDSAMISGSFSQREVSQLSSDLKAGSLTFTPHILSEKNVSPELGKADRFQGITATVVALLLVIVAMIAYYRFAGVVASVAVFFNLLILWATLVNLGATLSLAGIAGIILTVGMAVDANVLVFERIREEFAVTGQISSAIAAGYKKAYSAIIDSNVTTIIAALILLNFDAGPIKGFAITLIIGIVSSMFTALFMTRFYFNGWIQNPKNKALQMASWIRGKGIDFLKSAKIAFAIAAAIIVVGGYFLVAQRATIFGMDFTGGFSLHLEVENKEKGRYLEAVEEALVQQGAQLTDFQVRELSPSNHLRVLFGTSIEQPGKPFYQLSMEERLDWVVNSLQSSDITSTTSNWTAMSGQMSSSMRNNALLGLLISFVAIFIYIAFRFEYKFAAAAILCLFHDVLITLGLMGLLHAIGTPVQIDLNTIAALMTIIGYSLNDTIIIFDRIREEMQSAKGRPLPRIVNSALNATLSRTTITSGTTLIVLIALVLLGGASVFSFALVMTIGVFFGTLSSLYIASPLMLYFQKKEESKEKKLVQTF